MFSIISIFDTKTQFDADHAVATQTSKPEPHPAPSTLPIHENLHALKNVETKGGPAADPKPSAAFLHLKKEVHALERAALLARTEAQQKKYYEKAQKLWNEGLSKISDKDMFGESRTKTLRENFKTGVGIHKVQAGLWLIDSKYGQMLGTFGRVGMDNHRNYFTDKAIEKFRQDYNAGYVYGVPKPEKPLANTKEAKAAILRLAEARMRENWTAESYGYCQQARVNLNAPDKGVADKAYSTYFYHCEELTKEQAGEEAIQLRKMIEDPAVSEDARHSAMHLYWKLVRDADHSQQKNLLSETELTIGLGMMKRLAADEKTSYLLKSNTEEMIPTIVEKLAPSKARDLTKEESALVARAFNEKFPGDPLPKFSLMDADRYHKAFAELKAASYVLSESKDKDHDFQNKADDVWEKARLNYYKVCRELKVSSLVQRDTVKYFVDDAFSRKPLVAAA